MIHLLAGGANANAIFDQFWPYMLRSMPRDGQASKDAETLRMSIIKSLADLLSEHRMTPLEFGLHFNQTVDIVEAERRRYDQRVLDATAARFATLSSDQQKIVTTVERALLGGTKKLFYLQGEAGSGKTTALEVLIARLRRGSKGEKGKIVLPTSFMAIAASRLEGGDTCHRVFALPVADDTGQDFCPQSRLKTGSAMSALVEAADVMLVDEISMLHRGYLEAISSVTSEIMGVNEPFGGKVVIVTGDFKQLTPVVPGISRAALINASVLSSPLWRHFDTVTLRSQYRCDDKKYAAFVARVGYGLTGGTQCDKCSSDGCHRCLFTGVLDAEIHDGPFFAPVPPSVKTYQDDQVLEATRWVTGGDLTNPERMAHNVVIAFTHEICDQYNVNISESVRKAMGRKLTSCIGINGKPTAKNEIGLAMATPEFLAGVKRNNAPPTVLNLFPGCIITVLRNLNAKKGICNGVRAIVLSVSHYVLRCQIVSDNAFNGTIVDIPRIKFDMIACGTIEFTRLQFPVRIAYCITANRSQGMTLLGRTLLDARGDSFVHGQCYVALSRVKKGDNMRILGHLIDERGLKCIALRQLLRLSYDERIPTMQVPSTAEQPISAQFDSEEEPREEFQVPCDDDDDDEKTVGEIRNEEIAKIRRAGNRRRYAAFMVESTVDWRSLEDPVPLYDLEWGWHEV